MSFLKAQKTLVPALIALFLFSLLLTAVAFTPPAQAASCSSGQTQWRSAGCCACNNRNKRLYSCDSSGNWVDTGYTQCFYGECCAYPCCF